MACRNFGAGQGWRRWLAGVLLAGLAAPGAAFAGAWTLPKGEGIWITTAYAARAEKGFGDRRHRTAVPPFRKAEIQALVEYGVTDGFTLRGKTEAQRVRIGGPDPSERSGLGFSEVGGRYRFLRRGPLVASAEANLRVAEAAEISDPGFLAGYETEAEARLLVGTSFEIRERPAFVDLQAAYRFRDGGRPDEIRADLTFGVRPFPRTLALVQLFSTFAVSETGFGLGAYDYHKLQASLVYDLTRRVALQAGGYTTLAGRGALAEDGILLALWVRF